MYQPSTPEPPPDKPETSVIVKPTTALVTGVPVPVMVWKFWS